MSQNKDNLKDKLTPEEYYVTQNHGTEPAFSGKYDSNKMSGTYHCVVCGSEIFSSKEKSVSYTHLTLPTKRIV